jgi:DMSO/TMAO reductase YedYZ heme-binding membrane subunit
MKIYFSFIKNFQEFLLAISVVILATLPAGLVLTPGWFSDTTFNRLYAVAHLSLFLVMIIRPLADLFSNVTWIRPLVILRKGMGVLSAAIVVSFIIAKIMTGAGEYFGQFLTSEYWSFKDLAIFAHLADISAILLLVTSNNLSKKILGSNWKRLQKLSYVYFYGSGLYVFISYGEKSVFIYLMLVTLFTLLAWAKNHQLIQITPKIQ